MTRAARALLTTLALLHPALASGRESPATDSGMPRSAPEVLVVPGREVAIGVWPARPYQGAIVVVDVAAPGLTAARGTLRGAAVVFFPVAKDTLRGLAPVPDDAAPGKARLALRLTVGKRTLRRTVRLSVEALAFEKDRLKVDPRYTNPPEEVLPRIREERALLAALWKKGSSPEPRFTAGFLKPRDDRTTAPFGTRRVYNGRVRGVHQGWDIDGDVGDDVLCDNDGVVALARELYYSGGTMILDHGAGLYTVYFHLSAFAAKEGDAVRRGQPCGKVGASGRVTGPHLHWAARLGGHYLHPGALLLIPWEKPMVAPPGSPASGRPPGPPPARETGAPGPGGLE